MNLLHSPSTTIQNTKTIYVSDVVEDNGIETTFDFNRKDNCYLYILFAVCV